MQTFRYFIICSVFVLLIGVGTVSAQSMGYEENDWSSETESNPYQKLTRKGGTLLRGVEGETPAEQLAYADSLKAEGKLRKAGAHYNSLVHHWPDAPEAAKAQHAFARILLQRSRYDRAFREFQYLIEHYAGLFPYNEVLSEQLAAAVGVMEQRRVRLLIFPGFENAARAIPLFEVLIANAPNWEGIPAIRYLIGEIHEKDGDYGDAVAAYEKVIVHHGRIEIARDAIFRKAICLERIASKNPRDEVRSRTALQALFAALREDLDAGQAAEVQELVDKLRGRLESLSYEKAVFYDRTSSSERAALLAYEDFLRRFPETDKKDLVLERMASLRAQSGEKE